jgi:hypothetical protein
MTSETRKKMLERVKAILAKTMENGCTEGEAMAALAKARELMATYEIDEDELKEFDREKATIYQSAEQDPYDIKRNLGFAVGKFCRCEAWRNKNGQRLFCGMESDVIFATWLLDTLQRFVMRELRQYQKDLITKKGAYHSNNLTSASFVLGCVGRIVEKLKELTPKYETSAIVKAELAKNGIVLRNTTNRGREVNPLSYVQGQKAGEHARFDRPVETGGVKRLK